jgi:hypothetical protein
MIPVTYIFRGIYPAKPDAPHCEKSRFAICRRASFRRNHAVEDEAGEAAEAMDISEQLRTWRAFTGFVKWSASGAGLVMLTLVVFGLCG